MANPDYIDAMTEGLGDLLGIEGLRLNAEGRAGLNVGPLEVDLHLDPEAPEIFWISTVLGEMTDRKATPRFLLEVNFLSWLHDTMTISLLENQNGNADGDGYQAVGFTAIPTPMLTIEVLSLTFEKFCQAAVAIHSRLEAEDYSPLDETLYETRPKLPVGAVVQV
ncbi:MAG: type III secretion system chaperone [Pseudomonadota bacterium]